MHHPTTSDLTVRLLVPVEAEDAVLAYLAPPSWGFSLAAVTPSEAALAVSDGQLMLSLRPRQGDRLQRMPLLLPIPAAWHGALLWAFEPAFDSASRIAIRTCLVRLEWTPAGLALDLVPQDGRNVRIDLPSGISPDWLHVPLAPVAAALVVAVTAGLPVAAADYTVQPGDTLYGISRTYLGNGAQWRRLMAENRHAVRDPRRLMPGTRLHLPEGAPAAAATRRTVVVKPGDTLYGLARRHLGNGAKWRQLWQSLKGRIARPEQLPVGLVLTLPDTARAGRVVRPGDALPHRPAQPPVGKPATVADPSPASSGQGPGSPEEPATKPSRTAEPTTTEIGASATPAMPDTPPAELPAEPSPGAAPAEPPAEPSPAAASGEPAVEPSPDAASGEPAAVPSSEPASDRIAVASPLPDGTGFAADPSGPPPVIPSASIERPFDSHVALSYTPANHTEGLSSQGLSGQATIFSAFGGRLAWRAAPSLELSGSYQAGNYLVDRGAFGQGPRTEQHGRLMGAYVWPLGANLELAAGLGAQGGFYGAAAMPVSGRASDYFDNSYQRVMVEAEAKLGFRPIERLPLTLTAGVSALPYGTTLNAAPGLPNHLWGLGWQAGARYTLGGVAVEAGYRAQRVWGRDYQQSSDLLLGTVGYYFR